MQGELRIGPFNWSSEPRHPHQRSSGHANTLSYTPLGESQGEIGETKKTTKKNLVDRAAGDRPSLHSRRYSRRCRACGQLFHRHCFLGQFPVCNGRAAEQGTLPVGIDDVFSCAENPSKHGVQALLRESAVLFATFASFISCTAECCRRQWNWEPNGASSRWVLGRCVVEWRALIRAEPRRISLSPSRWSAKLNAGRLPKYRDET